MNQNDEFQALQHINKLITLAENNNFKELNKEHRFIGIFPMFRKVRKVFNF